MSGRLTIFSTIDDLREASDDEITASVDAVRRELVTQYIIELRACQNNPTPGPSASADLGEPIICRAKPTLPVLPPQSYNGCPDLVAPEKNSDTSKAARARSSRAQIKFTASFANKSNEDVDIIWKNYEGNEVLVRQGFGNGGQMHRESTWLTHPFIARGSETGQLKKFRHLGSEEDGSVVFEGLNFGVPHGKTVQLEIV